jgi:ribosomal protein S18 acetylase RimI-like enzyme
LWLRTLREMKLAGAARVTLWVLAKNERAIRFYRVAGFTEDVGSRKSIQIGGVSVDEVRYVRQLAG